MCGCHTDVFTGVNGVSTSSKLEVSFENFFS